MDKYEYRAKTEQMLAYAEQKSYQKAMSIADTIDWRKVKNTAMLSTVSEIYENAGELGKARDTLFIAYDKAPSSRKVVYRLGIISLKLGHFDEAADCYEEFVKLAPKDPNQYILRYKILKAQKAPVKEQIEALEDFKHSEYVEKWAYELARLYAEAGMTSECLDECDDLILWFSEGTYVYQAMRITGAADPTKPLNETLKGKLPQRKIVPLARWQLIRFLQFPAINKLGLSCCVDTFERISSIFALALSVAKNTISVISSFLAHRSCSFL